MPRDLATYNHLIRGFRDKVGDESARRIETVVYGLEVDASKAIKAVFNKELATSLDSLANVFARGITDIIDRQRLIRGTTLYDWVADNYGPVVDAGISNSAEGFNYFSARDHSAVFLELLPRHERFSTMLDFYKGVIGQNLIPPPSDFDIFFDNDIFTTKHGDEVERTKAILRVR